MSTNIIVGSGISGLIGAILLKKNVPEQDIIIVEKSDQIGGLIKSYQYSDDIVFDHGMHNFNETGIAELDEILWGLLGDDWQVLEGVNRDLAGLYFNDKLQTNSIYPDLRFHTEKNAFLSETLKKIDNPEILEGDSVRAFGLNRYGKSVTEKVIGPSISKIFGHDIQDLHYLAALIAPMDRMVFFDQERMDEVQNSSAMRERIAFPEQTKLPLQFSSGKKSLYPKDFGTWRIVKAIKDRLESLGVKIMTGCSVSAIHHEDGKITSACINGNHDSMMVSDISTFLWTTGIPQLFNLIVEPWKGEKPDIPRKTVLANFIFDRPIDCGKLHYFHCYQPEMRTFRVNNYFNYCSKAKNSFGYPVCAEMIIDMLEVNNFDILERGLQELRDMKVITNHRVTFSRAEALSEAFPMPTLKNIRLIGEMRNEINKLNLNNLTISGILSGEKLFFQRHILPDLYEKIMKDKI